MISLYGNRWTSQFGFVANDNGDLSEFAKEWQIGLSGLSLDQIKRGFDELTARVMNTKGECWPPSCWPDFRKLCLSSIMTDVPTLDEIVSTLITVSTRQGSLARRYRHPMALAISLACLRDGIDMFAIRNAKLADAKRMIKPAYEQCLNAGWNDWTEDELKEPDSGQKSLGHDKPLSKSAGRSFFSGIKAAL